jgi:eukaryotic-like serine/threonine-protein kinase
MKFLSDKALERLRDTTNLPDLEGSGYSLLGQVARGGMGVVYAAQDGKLNRRVALKVLHAPGINSGLASRLIGEAQILARLEHPGIVPVHDVGTLQDGRVYYTMKFVEGRRLDEHIQSTASIPDRLRLFLRICDAVAFAHARGVLHRDLKPANVMVGPFGEVLVLDWGLAKVLREPPHGDGDESRQTVQEDETSQATTSHGTVMGTPGYMSPEQARGDTARVDERSDIFSLGAILGFLIDAGRTTAIDKSLQAICVKATANNPADRYALVSQLADDLSRYLNGQPVTARKENLADKTVRVYRRHKVAILLIAAYLLMRIALVVFFRR